MEKSFDFKQQIEKANDPEILKQTLLALLERINFLEQKLEVAGDGSEKNESSFILEKKTRLEQIRHGLTEMNDRMERPYVISAELQAIKEVMDILAETGDCNSVILEGEPGTGKTQWAYSEVGQELQEGRDVLLVHVRVKDTMRAQDLLYSIDDVRRLNDAQAKAQVPEQIRQEAMAWKKQIVDGKMNSIDNAEYKLFKEKMQAVVDLGETAKDLDYLNYVDLGPLGEAIYQSGKGKKVYLLIDEIEKGREELMTGMLDEIENLTFTIGETGTVVKGDKKNLRIIITTNTEDSDKIPASFRRRSLYHFIDYPSRADMAQIVELNFPNIQKELLDYALSVFYQYQENSEIQKKPSTPELLSWVKVLSEEYKGGIPQDVPHLEILLKYKEDQELNIGKVNVEMAKNVRRKRREGHSVISGEINSANRTLKGEQVFHLTDDLNNPEDQDYLQKFYARLHNEGISFITPKFEKADRYSYDDDDALMVCVRDFQIVMPGVDYLGDGFYSIPEDKKEFFAGVIDKKAEVLSANQKFESVSENTSEFLKGVVLVEGERCPAYIVNGNDNRVVVIKSYKE